MAKISNIDVNSIQFVGGKEITSLSNISGFSTSNIPGWPSSVSCKPLPLSYDPGDPNGACELRDIQNWDFSNDLGILYRPGGCGAEVADPGFYAHPNGIYYFWDGTELSGPYVCGEPPPG